GAAHRNQFCLRRSTLRPHRIGERLHHLIEHRVARQTEDVVQVVGLAPRHHLAAAIVAVAADGDAGVRPVTADAPHHAPQMATALLAARRLARTEQNYDRTGVRSVVDVLAGSIARRNARETTPVADCHAPRRRYRRYRG